MIQEQIKSIEEAIAAQPFGSQPASLYAPLRYIMGLGGKRMRPLLVLMGYGLYREDWHKVVRYAVAVEAFHNFTLIHDDIMDNAPVRRGKPTIHEKWNVNTAILSGDVMLVRVYDMFLELDAAMLPRVLQLFNRCAAEVCEGQQWDMEFESGKKVTEAQYLSMIRQKTAVLIGFSLELGAMLAGAPADDLVKLRETGTKLGIGFQLRDDLLDVYGDRKKFGKLKGGDILANKKTFLLVNALDRARGKDKAELVRWITAKKFSAPRKIKAVTSIYDKLLVREATERKIKHYFDDAFSALHQLSVKERVGPIVKFAELLAERQS